MLGDAPRLASAVLVSALVRRADSECGNAAILARGDPDAGGILLVWRSRGRPQQIFEAWSDFARQRRWRPVFADLAETHGAGESTDGATDPDRESRFGAYIERQRRADADLWVVELDIAKDQRFAEDWLPTG